MKAFREGIKRNIRRGALTATAGVCLLSGLVSPALAAESKAQAPNPQEQAELAKFASYNGNIEVIAANEGNGLHAFLDENAGKTVFIESVVLRYMPAPDGVTAETRDKMPPTDRFENPVFLKCWGVDANKDGRLQSGDAGFPLPRDQADIEAGCSARIKIELAGGDYAGNVDAVNGDDKKEVYFVGFFDVKKEAIEGGKTLYRLAEVSQPEETAAAFYTHATMKDRPVRQVWTEAATPESGKAE